MIVSRTRLLWEYVHELLESMNLIQGGANKFLDNLDLGEHSKQLRICHKCEKLTAMNKLKFHG